MLRDIFVGILQFIIMLVLVGLSFWRLFSLTTYPTIGWKDYSLCTDSDCRTEVIVIVMAIYALPVALIYYFLKYLLSQHKTITWKDWNLTV